MADNYEKAKYKCRKCGGIEFGVYCDYTVIIDANGSVLFYDNPEWDECSTAYCNYCGDTDILLTFRNEK